MTIVSPLIPVSVPVTPEMLDALTRIDARAFTETAGQLPESDLEALLGHPGLSQERAAEVCELLQERRIERANQL